MSRFKQTLKNFVSLLKHENIPRHWINNQTDASCVFFSPRILLTEFQSSDLEIDSNRRNKCRIERVLGESKYYARLPNSAIAYKKKLEKQVKIRLRHFASLGPRCVT